jgi:aminopeptidase N
MRLNMQRIVTAILAGGGLGGLGPCLAAAGVFGNPALSHHAPKRTYHVENYRLVLRFKPTMGEVFGDETVTLTPRVGALRRFSLDSAGLAIEHVRLLGSTGHAGNLPFAVSRTKLWITLNHPYRRGTVLRVEIRYRGTPRAGLYFVNPDAHYPQRPQEIWSQGEPEFNHFWFPCWDYPNDMSSSETVTTVPASLRVVSNGRLVKVTRHGGLVTYDWVESVPHSSYLTSIAIGPWRKVSDHLGALPVDYFAPETVSASRVRRAFHLTPNMIGFFDRALGVPYPYEKYDQIALRHYFFGGMENVTATTVTDLIFGSARADADWPTQGVISHELGQHWFGDYVQGRDWADIWLNEGFATYLQDLYTQYREGNDAFRLQMRHDQHVALTEDREAYVRPIVDDHYTDPLQMFDGVTHQKGAVALDMLRNVLDGSAQASRPASQRELFFRALKSYLTTYGAHAVTTAQLEGILETVSKRRLGWFFKEWVYGAGHPDYRVTARYHAKSGQETIRIAQTQSGAGVSPVFVMPIALALHGVDGQSKTVLIRDRMRSETFDIAVPFNPLWIDFDPDDIIEKSLQFAQPLKSLIARSEQDPAPMSRIAAVGELARLAKRAPQAVGMALTHVLRSDSFYAVRVQAAIGLGNLHSDVATRALLDSLHQSDPRVRKAAVDALSGYHERPVYEALLAALHHDPSEAVQGAAARALGGDASFGSLWVLEQEAAQPIDYHFMKRVFAGLVATRDSRAVRVLLADARPGVNTQIRLPALQALQKAAAFVPKRDRRQLVVVVRSALAAQPVLIRLEGESLCGTYRLKRFGAVLQRLANTEPTQFQRHHARRALSELEHPNVRAHAPT